MAKRVFKNVASMKTAVTNNIRSFAKDVGQDAKKKLQELTMEWYKSYTPKKYKRTMRFYNSITLDYRNKTKEGYGYKLYYASRPGLAWLHTWINETGGYPDGERFDEYLDNYSRAIKIKDYEKQQRKDMREGNKFSSDDYESNIDRPNHMLQETMAWVRQEIGSYSNVYRRVRSLFNDGFQFAVRKK